jgi:hypothetical protein
MKNVKRLAPVLLSLALLAGTAACSGDDSGEYEQVCLDENTGQRVDDGRCPTDYHSNTVLYPGIYWYFYPVYYPVPAVGQPIPSSTRGYRYDRLPRSAKVAPTRPARTGGAVNPTAAKPKHTWQQPPKSNGGTGSNGRPTKQDPPKPASAPKASQPKTSTGGGSYPKPAAPRPVSPPRVSPPKAGR